MTAKTALGSRVRKWLPLVVACALPLEWFLWNKEDQDLLRQQFAVLLGVAIWIAVMAGLDAWLLRSGRTRASRALGFGALAFAVVPLPMGACPQHASVPSVLSTQVRAAPACTFFTPARTNCGKVASTRTPSGVGLPSWP